MATSNLQFQQNMGATVHDLQTQIGHLASTISEMKQQGSGHIPSQPVINPKGNVSAITLRSGKEVHTPGPPTSDTDPTPPRQIPLSFPSRAVQPKKVEFDTDLLETFSKVEINIPLLDAIKQIPKYAKFLKELCTHKRKLKGNEQVNLGRNVSALIQSKSVFSLS